MTTTSPTSSMATSRPTRKPERREILSLAHRGRRGPQLFLARGPCGRREYEVIPPPSEVKAAPSQSKPNIFVKTGP